MSAHHIRTYVPGMADNQAPRGDETGRFAIRVQGHLDARWSAWFDGLTVTTENDGTTLIEGPVADQAALFGLLQKMRDMGLRCSRSSAQTVARNPPLRKGTIMDRFTRSIAMASARHPWRTIAAWVLVMGTVLFLAASGGGTFADDFAAPGSQSDRAMELLDENFPEAAKGTALVVFAAEDGETLESHREAIASVLTDVATVDHVESVADPFAAGTVSEDGRIAFAELTLDAPEREIGKPAFAVLSDAVAGSDVSGVQVELGGDAVFLNAEDETSGHIGIGLLVALLVLLVVFGTLVAALVPIGLAIVSVGAGIGGITLLAGTMDVSVSAIPVAGLVGLGVGIDYALFIVARYRENRAAGQDNRGALANAMGSSGAAVVFAGGTVVIATAALAITGLGILTSIGLSTALIVLVAVAAAITLLPALLSLLGDRIDTGRLVRRHRPAKRTEDTAWWRFGHRVSGRPWPYLLGAVVALLALATPTLWIQTAFPAAGDAPPRPRTARPTTCSRRASAPGSTDRCWWSSTWTRPASTPPTCLP